MKRISLAIAVLAAALAVDLGSPAPARAGGAPFDASITGSGHLQTESRTLSGFDSIDLGCSADIEVVAGSSYSVTVTADDNVLPLIETTVSGHRLLIESHRSYSSQHDKVTIHLPTLKSLELSGSGDAKVSGVAGDEIALSIGGSGDINASGSVGKVNVSIEGSGDMTLESLDADEARVRIDGSGNARVTAKQSLDIEINGSGDVQYRGNPAKLRQVVNGSGSVSRL